MLHALQHTITDNEKLKRHAVVQVNGTVLMTVTDKTNGKVITYEMPYYDWIMDNNHVSRMMNALEKEFNHESV